MTRMVMPTAWGNHPENHVENHVENHPENQKSSQKGSQKSSQKILTLLLKDSQITTQEIANELGISRRAVAKQIANMSKKGLISRIGPDKGGYWQVNDNVDTKML